jgi:hypothetical protein
MSAAEPMTHPENRDPHEREGPGRRETDWQRPGFWLSVMGFLLTIALVLLGAIWNKLDTMDAKYQAFAINSHGQDIEIEGLKADRKEINAYLREQNAYNFAMSKATTEMATTIRLRGLPTPTIPDPPNIPKLGGQ